MKVLQGDYLKAKIVKAVFSDKKHLEMIGKKFPYRTSKFTSDDITSIDEITAENQKSFSAKAGWGTVGLLALGPLGFLAGAVFAGNKHQVFAVEFCDNTKALIRCNPKETLALKTLGY